MLRVEKLNLEGDIKMTQHKSYKNESQDARRHDKHDATHPYEKSDKEKGKSDENQDKHPHSHDNKRK